MLQQIRRYGPLLVGQFRPQWPKVVLLAALLFGNVGLQLANPLVLRRFIDAVASSAASTRLTELAAPNERDVMAAARRRARSRSRIFAMRP